MQKSRHYISRFKKGFTLVELLVTISIFALITTLTLANYPKFNTQTSTIGLAQQIAIAIREAQVYGIAVRNASSTSQVVNQDVYPAYGIFFATTSVATTFGNSTAYSIFYDANVGTGPGPFFRPIGDDYFTSSTELISTTLIQNGNRILSICGVAVGGSTCTPAYAAHVVFRRPNPDAIIKIITTPVTWPFSNPTQVLCSRIDIVIESRDRQYTKTIQVFSSGQINVK